MREFWLWVWSAVRPVFGWILAALGAVALFLGWYGVSGEALTAKQLPYLVSGGLTGIALIIVAGIILATDGIRRQLSRVDDLERKLDDLYGLFVEELAAPAAITPTAETTGGTFVALPAGSSYHLPHCALVTGKTDAVAVDEGTIRTRKLRPCRACNPTDVG